MILLIVIVLVVTLAVVSLVLMDASDGSEVFAVLCGVIVLLAGLVATITYFDSRADVVELRTFYETNAAMYADVRSLVQEGLTSSEGELDLANAMQIQAYANALGDQRDAVVAYNKQLANHRLWERGLLAGLFYVDAPDFLVSIRP